MIDGILGNNLLNLPTDLTGRRSLLRELADLIGLLR